LRFRGVRKGELLRAEGQEASVRGYDAPELEGEVYVAEVEVPSDDN
jgi:hypothetical protein